MIGLMRAFSSVIRASYRILVIEKKGFPEFLEYIKEKSININVNTIRA